MNSPTKTPIDQGLIARISGGVKAAAKVWFGPLEPLPAFAPPEERPSVAGRAFDYQVGINLQTQPRQAEPVSFAQMRALADACDVLRLVIETRKDQVEKLKWQVIPKDDAKQPDARCQKITDFFASPDKEHDWNTWLRMVLEDLFVIDAPAIYPRMTLGGELYSLEPVDGATIKRVIDATGRTPAPPDPAYQQILKGVPAVDYTREELIYRPRNLRTHKLYGYSPVEQIITTVNLALRRQLHVLDFYTEGSVPDALAGVPSSWNTDQIKQFQDFWDLMFGDSAARRRLRFIPDGVKYIPTKDAILKDEFDEWLARIVCFCFSVSPTPFVKQQNRATAENASQQAALEGLAPIQNWICGLMNSIIALYFKAPDLCFAWKEEEATDPNIESQIDDRNIRNGSMTIDEARAKRGQEALPDGLGSVPIIVTAAGGVRIADVIDPPEPQPVPAAFGGPEDDPDADPTNKPKAVPANAKEAFAKAKKARRPIDMDRDVIEVARTKLIGATEAFFASQAPLIAQQIIAEIDRLRLDRSRIDEALAAINFDDWIEQIPGLYAEVLGSVAVDGGAEAVAQVGKTLAEEAEELIGQKAKDWAETRAAEMVGMKWVDGELVENPDAKWVITDATRDMIRETVAQGMDEGWSSDKLSDALQEGYAFSDTRADMIARTETARADAQGQVIGWKAAGAKSKEWLTAPDCCDTCQDMNGAIAPVDGSFDGGEDVPLHPNCRCTCLPVIEEETEE